MPRPTLKDRVWAAVSVAKLRLAGNPLPSAAQTGGAEWRLLIGPANSAGQGYAWARAVERSRPGLAATSMQFIHNDDRYQFPVDQAVLSGYGAYSGRWQRAQFAALREYSAVLVESALPPLGGMHNNDPAAQISQLREAGVGVGLLFHGSDLRDPDLHLAAEPLSYFRVDPGFTAQMRARAARSRGLVERVDAPVFVSTPDLLTELPDATWLPVVVDVEAWAQSAADAPFSRSRTPVVVHVPSSSQVKGTALIEPVLRVLDAEGLIEYRSASGVPHAAVRKLVGNADIVVDQVRGGPYGVAACEAMAAGRVVVAHVPEVVRTRTRELSGQELPIVEAQPDTLEQVIRALSADPEGCARVSEAGRAFVKYWHDGRESGRVLATWLEECDAGGPAGTKSGVDLP